MLAVKGGALRAGALYTNKTGYLCKEKRFLTQSFPNESQYQRLNQKSLGGLSLGKFM